MTGRCCCFRGLDKPRSQNPLAEPLESFVQRLSEGRSRRRTPTHQSMDPGTRSCLAGARGGGRSSLDPPCGLGRMHKGWGGRRTAQIDRSTHSPTPHCPTHPQHNITHRAQGRGQRGLPLNAVTVATAAAAGLGGGQLGVGGALPRREA